MNSVLISDIVNIPMWRIGLFCFEPGKKESQGRNNSIKNLSLSPLVRQANSFPHYNELRLWPLKITQVHPHVRSLCIVFTERVYYPSEESRWGWTVNKTQKKEEGECRDTCFLFYLSGTTVTGLWITLYTAVVPLSEEDDYRCAVLFWAKTGLSVGPAEPAYAALLRQALCYRAGGSQTAGWVGASPL